MPAAAGTPNIALAYGGAVETMAFGRVDDEGNSPTTIFYQEQTPESLMDAVIRFRKKTFDRYEVSRAVDSFNVETFQNALRNAVATYVPTHGHSQT